MLEALDRTVDEPAALRLAIAAHVSGLASRNNRMCHEYDYDTANESVASAALTFHARFDNGNVFEWPAMYLSGRQNSILHS